MQETQVRSLGQEDLLEEEMATHSQDSCLENPKEGGTWRARVHKVVQESDTTERLTLSFFHWLLPLSGLV